MTANIQKIFEAIGRKYDYPEVTATWDECRDLKVSWIRTSTYIDIYIPDYLKGLESKDMKAMADLLFKRITMCSQDPYPKNVVEYLTSQEFRDKNVPTYLKRTTRVSPGHNHVDLSDSVARLKDQGLLSDQDLEGVTLRYCGELGDIAFRSSVLMKCALIHRRLDVCSIPWDIMDFLVYCAVKCASIGFTEDGAAFREGVTDVIDGYPDAKTYKKALSEMGLKLTSFS